eukprot:1266640-Prymnesium_polylepis.2
MIQYSWTIEIASAVWRGRMLRSMSEYVPGVPCSVPVCVPVSRKICARCACAGMDTEVPVTSIG